MMSDNENLTTLVPSVAAYPITKRDQWNNPTYISLGSANHFDLLGSIANIAFLNHPAEARFRETIDVR